MYGNAGILTWRDIDLGLVAGPDGTSAPRAASSVVRFGARADGAVATLVTPAGPVVLRHPGAAPVAQAVDKDRSTYSKALSGGRDLVLAATAEGFKESVVLPGASAPATYTEELVLPPGLSARQTPGGVELIDAARAMVATYANGTAHDAAFPANGPGGLTPVTVTLAKSEALVATITVAVDPAWLSAPGRTFPVTVDPLLTLTKNASAANGGQDTYVQKGANANTVLGATAYLFAGTADAGVTANRTLMSFNLGTSPAPDVVVTEATLTTFNFYSVSCSPPAPVSLQGLGGAWTQATATWNNQPIVDAASPVTNGPAGSSGATGCPAANAYYDVIRQAQRWMDTSSPNYGLLMTTSETNSAAIRGWYSAEAGYASLLNLTYDHLPGPAVPVAPANNAVLATTTPLLEVGVATDVDGDTVRYWYTVSTSPDASIGQRVVWSGWLGGGAPYENPDGNPNGTSYRIPAGALQDGVTYFWGVSTWDGVNAYTSRPPPAASLRSFTVELGQGAQAARPKDAMGPMGVDLISGNVSTGHASPALPTVGGSLGVSYGYNSAGAAATSATAGPGRTSGLRGTYFNGTAQDHEIGTKTAVLSRRDSNLAFVWSGDHDSPAPGVVNPDNFMVRWTGKITLPKTSTQWRLWTANDGGVRIWVNNIQIVNAWTDHYAWPEYSTVFSATKDVPLDITIEYFEQTGAGLLALGANGPLNTDGTFKEVIVPTGWLSTEAGPLPAGWSLGAGALGYESLRLGEDAAVAIDPSGASHVYRTNGPGGGFTPPPDSDAILGVNGAGAPTLHGGDGLSYVFDSAGQLKSATAATDDANRSSPEYAWSTFPDKPRRLTRITDPVSGRFITLRYMGLDPALACPSPPPALLFTAPAFQLCQVLHGDGTDTKLWYNANGQLARIADPGDAVTDFAYNAERLLSSRRDPLAADAVAAIAVTGRADDATVRTAVAYNTVASYGDGPTQGAASVTLPAPTASAARPAHSYAYSAAQTTVTAAASPANLVSTATFVANTAGGLTLGGTDADGISVGSAVYDAGDRLLSSTDAAGRRSTAIYDSDAVRAQPSGRVTHTYGPAPSSCFGGDNQPNGTCVGAATTPPHTTTAYDTAVLTGDALTGLAATYWPNRTLADEPANHEPVVPTSGSVVPANPPAGGLAAGNWSARYTGEVDVAQTGTYGFAGVLTGQARVFIDDRLVVDAWAAHASTTTVTGSFANALAGRHRIRVDYATDTAAVPALALRWTPPGGTDSALPAASLAPRYSSATASVSDDTTAGVSARTVDTAYLTMATGLVTDSTTDRAGMNMVTSTAYEGSRQYRRSNQRLGAT